VEGEVFFVGFWRYVFGGTGDVMKRAR